MLEALGISKYVISASLLLTTVGAWYYCFARQRHNKALCEDDGGGGSQTSTTADTDTDNNERTPLVSRRTQKVIAKFERRLEQSQSQNANNNTTSAGGKQHGISNTDSTRCAVCRKTILSSTAKKNSVDEDTIITYQKMTMHGTCFSCRDCGKSLIQYTLGVASSNDDKENKSIYLSKSNGKVKLHCATCHEDQSTSDVYATQAGSRKVVEESEHGDVQQVMEDIGDDLEQAVYFQTPKCATCGDNLTTRHKQQQQAKGAKKFVVMGRTVYHPNCYETGRPPSHWPAPAVKLPPSFCAKYLPRQIILKLVEDGITMTTLYFCWKNREAHAVQLRQQDAAIVTVPWVLDETAPANPNYQRRTENDHSATRKQKPAAKQITIPSDVSTIVLELVSGVEVAPRVPQMPEPARIDSLGGDDNENNQYFHARLVYLHFGLEYSLTLQVSVAASGENGSQYVGNLVRAQLSVTIQDWQHQ